MQRKKLMNFLFCIIFLKWFLEPIQKSIALYSFEFSCSLEKSLENDRLREELRSAEDLNKKSQEVSIQIIWLHINIQLNFLGVNS